LVNDGGKKTLYQQTALADIELEKFLFMKVSEVLQQLTNQSGNEKHVLGVAVVVIENILISNLEHHSKYSELNCIFREFCKLQQNWMQSNSEIVFLKNLKAAVERAERYANQFT